MEPRMLVDVVQDHQQWLGFIHEIDPLTNSAQVEKVYLGKSKRWLGCCQSPSETVPLVNCFRLRDEFLVQNFWYTHGDDAKESDQPDYARSPHKIKVHTRMCTELKRLLDENRVTPDQPVLLLDTFARLSTIHIHETTQWPLEQIIVCNYQQEEAEKLAKAQVVTFPHAVDVMLRSLPISALQFCLVFLDFTQTINPHALSDPGRNNAEAVKWLFQGQHCMNHCILALTWCNRGNSFSPDQVVEYVIQCASAAQYTAIHQDQYLLDYGMMRYRQFLITKSQ